MAIVREVTAVTYKDIESKSHPNTFHTEADPKNDIYVHYMSETFCHLLWFTKYTVHTFSIVVIYTLCK